MPVEAGYVRVNMGSAHVTDASFGGWKQSGIGLEESIEELLSYTQEKAVTMLLRRRHRRERNA